jgi:FAD/FMN-containing dehydrogenase
MTLVNDVHSRLNATRVDGIVPVDSVASIRTALQRARAAGKPVAIAGGRHSMGGQQFCSGGVLLDTRPLDRVLSVDVARSTVEVEAGIQWPALAQALAGTPLTFAQKQTGANDLSLGGALSSNVHGRGLAMRPFVGDVESFTLVDAGGRVLRCSRDANPELFSLAIGGYGLFGVIYSVTLRLVRRRTLERVVELATADDLVERLERRVADGFVYGDFQFAIDAGSDDFLHRGVLSCYRLVADRPIPQAQRALGEGEWRALLGLAHTDKSRAFELYAQHYLATSGQLHATDTHQLGFYSGGYHDEVGPGSETIAELYVPRRLLAGFLGAAAHRLRQLDADVIYGTVRLIERDDETVLAWAREPWACVVMNLHVDHDEEGRARAATAFIALNDLAIERGGSFYLTYHRWSTRSQLEAAYPQLQRFLAAKRWYDPDGLFQSDWYRWLSETVSKERAA